MRKKDKEEIMKKKYIFRIYVSGKLNSEYEQRHTVNHAPLEV